MQLSTSAADHAADHNSCITLSGDQGCSAVVTCSACPPAAVLTASSLVSYGAGNLVFSLCSPESDTATEAKTASCSNSLFKHEGSLSPAGSPLAAQGKPTQCHVDSPELFKGSRCTPR